MFGSSCGCTGSGYSPNPGNGIDEQSNASGIATWDSGLTTNLSPQGIEGRSPYGIPPIGGISFCRKCFLTWAVVFIVIAYFLLRKR